jgi:repressor LexA
VPPAESLPVSDSSIPLLGKVAAGNPIEAVENPDTLSLPEHFGTGDDIFALEVTGDSMIEEDIHNGDYIICKKTQTAGNGELVVAITDNENATLKRIYKEKGKARLQPANKNYDPIYSDNCRIEAKAIGLLRKF